MDLSELKSRDGAITAARAGQGRDIVVLHSLLTDRTAFDPVVPELAKTFRVTLVNLPGFHGSHAVGGTLRDYVSFVRRAFEDFDIAAGAILMGNGFGGTVALGYAVAYPASISKLVLVDVAPGFPPEGKKAFQVMSEKVALGGLGAIADIAANRVFHAAYLAAHPKAIEERRAVLLKIDPGAFRAACDALVNVDLVPALPAIETPVLVVFGELDQATPPALNLLIASRAPNARAVALPDCGHCPPLERPDLFLDAIRDFIAA